LRIPEPDAIISICEIIPTIRKFKSARSPICGGRHSKLSHIPSRCHIATSGRYDKRHRRDLLVVRLARDCDRGPIFVQPDGPFNTCVPGIGKGNADLFARAWELRTDGTDVFVGGRTRRKARCSSHYHP
jgi:hypothetical protein